MAFPLVGGQAMVFHKGRPCALVGTVGNEEDGLEGIEMDVDVDVGGDVEVCLVAEGKVFGKDVVGLELMRA